MKYGKPACDVALMLRVPHSTASVYFRAYAQRVRDSTVLRWVLSRMQTLAPPHTPIVCVCDSEAEKRRLMAAAGDVPPRVAFLSLVGRDEMQQCHAVMDGYQTPRLIVAGLSHAAVPDGMLRDLYQLHVGSRAQLSEATGGTFADACYVVDATFVDRLETTVFRTPALTTLQAATLLREEASVRGERASDFLWIESHTGKRYGISPEQWPETIGITSGRDVDIVRQVIDEAADLTPGGTGLISLWKRASINTRHRRFALQVNGIPARRRKVSDRRARVLYASHMSAFTGAQQSLCHLIGALDLTQYEACALVSYEGTFTDALRRRGVDVICPNHSISKNDPENLVFARRVLEACDPDLVHMNHSIGMPFICAAMAAGLPMVQHVRIPDLWTLREHIVAADAVIAVSHFVRQQIATLDIDLEKVHVIWNGVLGEEFEPHPEDRRPAREQLGLPTNEFVVAMIARLSRSKRHDTVIAALNLLRRQTGRGHLLLIGVFDGDLPYVREIETLIQREGLVPFITRIDFMSDIRPVLYASDVLVLPSEDEPLGRAVLEGMAVGLPVVVGDSGGSKEVLDAGVTGFVVPCGDSCQLANILIELADKPAWAQQIGAAAARKVQQSLTAQVCATKTAALYEQVLIGRRSQ